MKILSLLPVLGHPRDSKRITMLKESGFEVTVQAFERDYHSGRLPDCDVEVLGKISHGNYMNRIIKLIKALPKIRRGMKKADMAYASGPDMALIGLIAGFGLNKPVALEVGDIRDIQLSKSISGKIVRFLDKKLVDSCCIVVVISQGFKDVYYKQWLKTKTPVLLIENKLESSFVESLNKTEANVSNGIPLVDRPLRIGYFGLLRDKWTWDVLEKLALTRPDAFEIVMAGFPMDPIQNLPELIKKYKNIEYLGEYRSPHGLQTIYDKVDMVWACYPPMGENDWNFKWGRPNRFFESCCFQKPLFIRAGCHCGTEVEQYQIGKLIDDFDVDRVATDISNIKPEEFTNWKKNMATLPQKLFMYTDEANELRDEINKLFK